MTPLMEQYNRIKAQHRDAILFFRLGDFYEMFYEDAETASRALGLTLTSRTKEDKKIPMAGIPFHAATPYINRLLRQGYRVAICEQVEDPKTARGIVARSVVRIITPGTVLDEGLLDAKESNFLCAVCTDGSAVGLAWVDLSTGSFFTEETSRGELANTLARISPSECLIPDAYDKGTEDFCRHLKNATEAMLTPIESWVFDESYAKRLLMEHFQVSNLTGFGIEDTGPAIGSAGAILHYLRQTQKVDLCHIRKIERFRTEGFVHVDRQTRRALELTETLRERSRYGTLLWLLDRTRTAMGGRLLREWILSPLSKVEDIRRRHDGVEEIVRSIELRHKLDGALKDIQDMERLIGRVACRTANARDLLALSRSAGKLPLLKASLEGVTSDILRDIRESLRSLDEVVSLIESAIDENPPPTLRDGGIIKKGYSAELDELRDIKDGGKKWLSQLERRESQRTSIPSLKVGYTSVFGYYIEITNAHRDKVPAEYIRKQTLKNAERYITPELKEFEAKILNAEERSKELEYELFQAVREKVAEHIPAVQASSSLIAQIDALASLAVVAVENGYVRPIVDEGFEIEIEEGRHPVLEKVQTENPFVPNDIKLGRESRVLIITGPNMAGKSTYIRQAALLVLMAQIGSFIPARKAHVGVVDRIFTRVGASDELMRGLSTFMVEMTETANILNNATERSLIVLDEVGRGTSTFDGISIAWAVAEYIHEHIGARTLFATHYHELTELAIALPNVRNYNVAVKEWGDRVIFLHRIEPGGTDKSYGIHVARLSGIPREVVERARVILKGLEERTVKDDAIQRCGRRKAGTRGPSRMTGEVQLSLLDSTRHPVVEQLQSLNIESMTPLEALIKLKELKEAAGGK